MYVTEGPVRCMVCMSAYSPACDYNHSISVAGWQHVTTSLTYIYRAILHCNHSFEDALRAVAIAALTLKRFKLSIPASNKKSFNLYSRCRSTGWLTPAPDGLAAVRARDTSIQCTYLHYSSSTNITHYYDCVMSIKPMHGTMPPAMYH